MDSKARKTVYLISIILMTIIFTSCDPKNSCYVYHQVTFPINLYAKSDTIHLGDTVSLEVAFPRKLKEELYEEYIYLPEDFIKHNLSIVKIDKDTVQLNSTTSTGAISSFKSFSIVGNLTDVFINYNQLFTYLLKNDSVFGSFKFIAQDTGTFVFYLIDFAYYKYRSDLPYSLSNTDCFEEYWPGLMLNKNEDNNFYIIKKHHVFFDTTMAMYFDRDYSGPEYANNPNVKNGPNDNRKNLRYGTFSVVVR